MARHYHIDIAVFAADADRKWVDNLLSHFDVPGVDVAGQGVARRISTTGIYHIALVHELSRAGGVGVERGLELAMALLSSDHHATAFARDVTLNLDRESFQRRVDRKISDAVEAIVPKRRGRPRGRSANK